MAEEIHPTHLLTDKKLENIDQMHAINTATQSCFVLTPRNINIFLLSGSI
jgi:hypothetical protein